jgi:ferredoxin
MLRKIIKIDESACNGCGLCVSACHEGAIGLADGKAKLLRDDYCDGLGDCLPVCPTGAITFEEREAAEYNEAAVKVNMQNKQPETLACGCPGTHSKPIERENCAETPQAKTSAETHLNQWPVQIKLVPPNAPYFKNANLLVTADCAAYAYGNFHNEYMKNRITIIGCPKLDDGDYSEKLTAILKSNEIKSVTVARMEVPCCGGIENAVKTALQNCGKMIPWQVVTISTDGRILEN